jgi:glycosyltransferase involved in cell wall biosynthesis
MHPVRELRVLRQLSAIYALEKPDIVHHFTIKCIVYGSLIAWRHGIRNRVNAVAGMGYVFTSRELRARLLKPFVQQLIRLVVKGKRSRLIVQNRDDFIALRGGRVAPADQIRLIRSSGVDMTRFSPSPRKAECRITRVLFAARLLWDKGLGEYIDAARELQAADVAIELLLAGMPDIGNPTSVAMEQVKQWQANGLITHLGHVSDMPKLLSEVDIAVLPSYREGAPRSLVEAAAAGLPIVTTDVPGCRETVDHGVNGLLVPVRDSKALAGAIRYLHEHPEERQRMGDAGREKALREFDQRSVFEDTHAIYCELLTCATPKRNEKVLQA